jgi:hypothetical protein
LSVGVGSLLEKLAIYLGLEYGFDVDALVFCFFRDGDGWGVVGENVGILLGSDDGFCDTVGDLVGAAKHMDDDANSAIKR